MFGMINASIHIGYNYGQGETRETKIKRVPLCFFYYYFWPSFYFPFAESFLSQFFY
jgi:hypothetical protein